MYAVKTCQASAPDVTALLKIAACSGASRASVSKNDTGSIVVSAKINASNLEK